MSTVRAIWRYVANPLAPGEREPIKGGLEAVKGTSVLDAVMAKLRADGSPLAQESVMVVVNGVPLNTERAKVTPLAEGDVVRVSPRPKGLELGSIAVALILGVASAGLSAVLGSFLARSPEAGSNVSEERRYGFGRFSSDAIAGDPIGVVLGEVARYGGKVIGLRPGEGPDGDARLSVLISMGHGPVESIGGLTSDSTGVSAGAGGLDIDINDQPIGNFPACSVSVRMGTESQAAIPGWSDVSVLRDVGVGGAVLRNTSGADRSSGTPSGEAFSYITLDPINHAVVRVRFKRGLYTVTSSGQTNPRRVSYRVRTEQDDGAGGWLTPSSWQAVTVERADQSDWVSSFRLQDVVTGTPKRVRITAERVSAEPPPGGVTDSDEMTFDSVLEVREANENYAGIALLAVDLVASEQLTSKPRIGARVKGLNNLRLITGVDGDGEPIFDTGWSANPADLWLEVATNTTWGAGAVLGGAKINWDQLLAWREHCAQLVDRVPSVGGQRPYLRCDLVLGEKRKAADWLNLIAQVGRCRAVVSGSRVGFAVDKAQSEPVEIFGNGSIAVDDEGHPMIEVTREPSRGGLTRPNRYTAQIEDDTNNGRANQIVWPQYGEEWLGAPLNEPVNEQSVRLEGVRDPEQAFAEVKYRMKSLRTRERTIKLTPIDLMPPAVQPGDRFDVACELLGWGTVSGRLAAGSGDAFVILDQDVSLASGTSYEIVVVAADGTHQRAPVVSASGYWPAGSPIFLGSALSAAPARDSEYMLGPTGASAKAFVCTRVSCTDTEEMRFQIEGVEYDERAYDDSTHDFVPVSIGTLMTSASPPGPVVSVAASERTVAGRRSIELACAQTPADAAITDGFRVYRRLAGGESWVLVPQAVAGRRSAVVDISDWTVAYEIIMVARTATGAQLSPYDVRHPRVAIAYGLAAIPPDPPASLAAANVGNTYALSWAAVAGVSEYQVLGCAVSDSAPNAGAQNAAVVARVSGTTLGGLELAPGLAHRFWVRSVTADGRLSFTASTVNVASAALPAGKSVKNSTSWDLSTDGTRTNCTWTASRLRMTDPTADAVWLSPEVDTGAATLAELCVRLVCINDAQDPVVSSVTFAIPSIEADQWGVVSTGPAVVGMLMPPYPDNRQAWIVEVRTHDGSSWGAWEPLALFGSVERAMRKYQVRVTMRRGAAPYRPALASVAAVATH